MSDLYYSHDEETFEEDIYCVAEYAFDYPGIKVGDIITIYSGERNDLKASFFFGDMDAVERMRENAYEYFGEADFIESWLDGVSKEQDEELLSSIRNTIDSWADKYKKHPTFFGIKNVKEVKIKFLGEDKSPWFEVVENEPNH